MTARDARLGHKRPPRCEPMSWLNRAFRAPKRAVPTAEAASDALSVQMDVMSAKVGHLDALGEVELKRAKAIGTKTAGSKAKALACLKRYKSYQAQIVLITRQCDNLAAQKSSIDMAVLTSANLTAMEAAAKLTSTVNADCAAGVMDEVAAQVDIVAEICEILADPVGTEGDPEAELEAWLGEETDVELAMPDVPTTAPDLGSGSQAVQLEKLNAWMA